jgi:hypothetical protein
VGIEPCQGEIDALQLINGCNSYKSTSMNNIGEEKILFPPVKVDFQAQI